MALRNKQSELYDIVLSSIDRRVLVVDRLWTDAGVYIDTGWQENDKTLSINYHALQNAVRTLQADYPDQLRFDEKFLEVNDGLEAKFYVMIHWREK